ncbi:MAG TPA: hypothetical protein VHM25_12670 [Polyangiaceae bacterium]|nr:hypothetical protein [Polyangiaceae bacterium]
MRRKTANLLTDIRFRKPRREQRLDLSSSLALTLFEEFCRVLFVEVRGEGTESTQVQFAPSNAVEHPRKSTTHTHRRHAPPRNTFAHTQRFHAVRKQRRETELQMQPSLVELNQVRQHLRSEFVAPLNEPRQPRDELRIPDLHQPILVAHRSSVPCVISSRALLLRSRFQPKINFELTRIRQGLFTQNLGPAMPKIQSTSHDEAT